MDHEHSGPEGSPQQPWNVRPGPDGHVRMTDALPHTIPAEAPSVGMEAEDQQRLLSQQRPMVVGATEGVAPTDSLIELSFFDDANVKDTAGPSEASPLVVRRMRTRQFRTEQAYSFDRGDSSPLACDIPPLRAMAFDLPTSRDSRGTAAVMAEEETAFVNPSEAPAVSGDVGEEDRVKPGPLQLILESSLRNVPPQYMMAMMRGNVPSAQPIPAGSSRDVEAEGDAVMMVTYYGAKGVTIAEQLQRQREEEAPPDSWTEMPLKGGVRDESLWNPINLHAAILVIPLLLFIIIFGILLKRYMINPGASEAVSVSYHLSELLVALSKEQSRAAVLQALANQKSTVYASNPKDFYSLWHTAVDQFQASQIAANKIIASIVALVAFHEQVLERALSGLTPWCFLDISDLSLTRVLAVAGSTESPTLKRYDDLLNHLLLYRGALSLWSSTRFSMDVADSQILSSIQMRGTMQTIRIFLAEKGRQSSVVGEFAALTDLDEVRYVYAALAMQRVEERTLRYPAALRQAATTDGSFASQSLTYVDTESCLLNLQIPSVVTEALSSMLLDVYKEEPYAGWDTAVSKAILGQVDAAAERSLRFTEELNAVLSVLQETGTRVQEACLIVLFCLATVGLLYHIFSVLEYLYDGVVIRRMNLYVRQLRASLLRMHATVLRVIHLQVRDVDPDNKVSKGANPSQISAEEREFYGSARLMRALEPFLPLPMRYPPPGVPPRALLYGTLFVRPTLLEKKGLVVLRLSFLERYVSTAPLNPEETEGTARQLTSHTRDFHPVSSMRRQSVASGAPTAMMATGGSKGDSESSTSSEMAHASYVLAVLQFLCRYARALLPQSRTGPYVEHTGEHVTFWLNLCEDIPQPHLLAFHLCATVEEFCLLSGYKLPHMAVCAGDGILGNVGSARQASGTIEMPAGGASAGAPAWNTSVFFDADSDVALAGSRQPKESPAAVSSTVPVRPDLDQGADSIEAMASLSTRGRISFLVRHLLFGERAESPCKAAKNQHAPESAHSAAAGQKKVTKRQYLTSGSENEDLVLEGGPTQPPSEEAANLTSFTVYGDILDELDVLVTVQMVHQQWVVANSAAVTAMLAERALHGLVPASNKETGGPFSTSTGDRPGMRPRPSLHFPHHSSSTVLPASRRTVATGVHRSSGRRAPDSSTGSLGMSTSGAGSRRHFARAGGAPVNQWMEMVLSPGEAAERLRNCTPQCIPLDVVEVDQQLRVRAPPRSRESSRRAAKAQQHKRRHGANSELAARPSSSHLPTPPPPPPEELFASGGGKGEYDRIILVHGVHSPEADPKMGTWTLMHDIRGVYGVLWKLKGVDREAPLSSSVAAHLPGPAVFRVFSPDTAAAEEAGSLSALSLSRLPLLSWSFNEVEGGGRLPQRYIEDSALQGWIQVFRLYSSMCEALSMYSPQFRQMTTEETEGLRAHCDAVIAAALNFRRTESRCDLSRSSVSRILDVAHVARLATQSGGVPNGLPSAICTQALDVLHLYSYYAM